MKLTKDECNILKFLKLDGDAAIYQLEDRIEVETIVNPDKTLAELKKEIQQEVDYPSAEHTVNKLIKRQHIEPYRALYLSITEKGLKALKDYK